MATAGCPECGRNVHVRGTAEFGDQVRCESCGTHLLVIGLEPLDLYWADEEEQREEKKEGD